MRIIPLILILLLPTASAQEWWELETQMEEGGKLDLSSKSWWKDAAALGVGEQIEIDSKHASAGEGKACWLVVSLAAAAAAAAWIPAAGVAGVAAGAGAVAAG